MKIIAMKEISEKSKGSNDSTENGIIDPTEFKTSVYCFLQSSINLEQLGG